MKHVVFCLAMLFFTNAVVGTESNFERLNEIQGLIGRDYVHPDLDYDVLETAAIEGYLEGLQDPYTRYLSKERYAFLKSRMEGELWGVDLVAGIKEDDVYIVSVVPGGMAESSGIAPLQRILEIDGVAVEGLSLEEVNGYLRGPEGSTCSIVIQDGPEEPRLIEVKRQQEGDDFPIREQRIIDKKIGYIWLHSLTHVESTRHFVETLRQQLSNDIHGLILDLRGNAGGLLQHAVDIASLFVSEGVIVQTVNKYGRRHTEKVTGAVLFKDKPLVVLVNRGTASAAEVLAGAIQDHNRGVLVGQRTFGKATVQRVVALDDGSALVYTVAQYLSPKGSDITALGIDVDEEVEDSEELDSVLLQGLAIMKRQLGLE